MSPPTTFHLVPRAEWEATDPSAPYTPSGFGADGFVHCTDGADEILVTPRADGGPFLPPT